MSKDSNESNIPAMLVTFAILILLIVLCCVGGCVPVEIEQLKQEVAALAVKMTGVQGDVSAFKGNIGGGGDSIIAWWLAAGYVVPLLLPSIIRPWRQMKPKDP